MNEVKARRAKGTGGLYTRKGIYYISYVVNGEKKEESTGTTNYIEAERLLQRKLIGIEDGQWIGSAKVKVGDLLDDLLTDYKVRGLASLKTTRCHMPRLRNFFGHVKAIAVTKPMLMRAVARWQDEGLKPATINKHLGTLRRALTLAAENRKMGKAAIPTFPSLPENNARQTYLGVAEMVRIIGELPDDGLRDLAEWLYGSSQRWGEVAAMTWDMFNQETWEIRIPGELVKNSQPRIITVLAVDHLRPILERRLAARRLDCPFIFHRGGQPIRVFRKSWNSACQRALGIPGNRSGITPHDLRHIAATDLLDAGVAETIIMQIGGWETAAMFRRYAIKRKDMVAKGLNALGEYRKQALSARPKVVSLHAAAQGRAVKA